MPRSGCNVISRSGPLHNRLIVEDCVGSIVATDATDGTTATRSTAAQQHPRMGRCNPPALGGIARLFVLFQPGPRKIPMEYVAAGHTEGVLDLGRRLVLDCHDQRLDRLRQQQGTAGTRALPQPRQRARRTGCANRSTSRCVLRRQPVRRRGSTGPSACGNRALRPQDREGCHQQQSPMPTRARSSTRRRGRSRRMRSRGRCRPSTWGDVTPTD